MRGTNSITAEDIENRIDSYKQAISQLEKTLAEFNSFKQYEVGIRKIDNVVVHIAYHLSNSGMMNMPYQIEIYIHVLPPDGNTSHKITVEEFKNGFVEYSPKARTILPKRER